MGQDKGVDRSSNTWLAYLICRNLREARSPNTLPALKFYMHSLSNESQKIAFHNVHTAPVY